MQMSSLLPVSMDSAEEEYIFRSWLPDIEIPNHLPLNTYCFENSIITSSACLIDAPTGNLFTYADVDTASRRVAARLQEAYLRHGDVMMILLPNSPQFVFTFLAASLMGIVSTPANPLYTPSEIAKQATSSGAKLIVTESEYAEKVMRFADKNDIKVACIDSPVPVGCLDFSQFTIEAADSGRIPSPVVKIDPDDTVAVPYSSGTTGFSKGVMLTHKSLVTNISQLVDGDNPNLYIHKDDVVICVLPLFHIYSLHSVLLCAIRVGATVLIVRKFEINSFLELVHKYKVTVAPIVPPIVLEIAKNAVVDTYDLSSIRLVISGAAPMRKELQEALRAKIPNAKLGQAYGMTEAGPAVAMCSALARENLGAKPGSCGMVVRNAEMKIMDPDSGASLPPNNIGEICVRGSQIMKGYLNDREATENTIDNNGWLHTGDMGYVDDDGYIFIVDRLKELIKYKGFQVAPAELEALLVAHPDILDAAVVPMKDEAVGEIPVAFVVKTQGSSLSEHELKLYISSQVIFYKRIRRVFFVEAIPKAPSGKILRKDLRLRLSTIVDSHDFPVFDRIDSCSQKLSNVSIQLF